MAGLKSQIPKSLYESASGLTIPKKSQIPNPKIPKQTHAIERQHGIRMFARQSDGA